MIISQPKELIAAFVNLRQGSSATDSWGAFNALGLVKGGRLVAGVIYNDYCAHNANMHIGAEEGCRWMNRDFLFSAFDYPFNQLGFRRVTAKVKSGNRTAIDFIENLGFTYEGTMRRYFKADDALIYGMLKEECRFLGMKHSRIELRKAA